jgi:beta-galactosidase/beta-glucuronidase
VSRPRASAAVVAAAHGYPRPQLVRDGCVSLNGAWSFAIDEEARLHHPSEVEWRGHIQVPFSPETTASGIRNTGFYRAVWYRRTFSPHALEDGDRQLLHFGAVDNEATVWVNGRFIGVHTGGYTPFSFDITNAIAGTDEAEVVVRAFDDPFDLALPRGKQDWQIEPHSIWYPRTTGIWQTVWTERVPPTWIANVRWTPSLLQWELGLEVFLAGDIRDDLTLNVEAFVGDQVIAHDRYGVISNEVHRRIALSDPGIDDYRNELLWSPARPRLIDVVLELRDRAGDVVDRVLSYTALRSFAAQGDRLLLNGRPLPLRLVLDQGYWPLSGLTPPNDLALRTDVELAKAMGFNGVRKHQKVEDPRYLFWADVLGLMVWAEMPSAYRYTWRSIQRLSEEWLRVIERDYSHPSVIVWVPFNESWGVPNLPESVRERHYVQGLYHLTKALDTTRPVVGNDGWESIITDIIGIHDYDDDPARLAHRYHADKLLPRLLKKERPGGRELILGEAPADRPVMLTEFGGITLSPDPETWGYARVGSADALQRQYEELLAVVHASGIFSGFCYTQFSDTYQEANGLLTADRRPKLPLEAIAAATRGRRGP